MTSAQALDRLLQLARQPAPVVVRHRHTYSVLSIARRHPRLFARLNAP